MIPRKYFAYLALHVDVLQEGGLDGSPESHGVPARRRRVRRGDLSPSKIPVAQRPAGARRARAQELRGKARRRPEVNDAAVFSEVITGFYKNLSLGILA